MTQRTEKLASSVRKIVAPILRECPTACGIVTITRVELSSDLSYATLYISALQKSDVALAFLESRQREMQRTMGQLQTHKTPQLRFRIDTTSLEASRIDELLS